LDLKNEENNQAESRIRKQLRSVMKESHSLLKRNMILQVLAEESKNGMMADVSFFKTLEIDMDEQHRLEVSAAIDQYMAKARRARRGHQLMVKSLYRRKEALENKLFQMKYAKLLKHISANNSLMATSTIQNKPSSIYEENPSDPKMGIPANDFLLASVVKDTFEIYDSSSDEEEAQRCRSDKERYDDVMQIFEEKNPVKAGCVFGPSQRKLNRLDCI